MTNISKGYEYTWYRSIKCKLCGEWIPIFSLGHYKNVAAGTDEFSKNLMNFYLYGNDKVTLYFLNGLRAKEVIFFTLGLSSKFGIYKDFDLNPNINFRARGVIERFHSNKLTKEERDKHRL